MGDRGWTATAPVPAIGRTQPQGHCTFSASTKASTPAVARASSRSRFWARSRNLRTIFAGSVSVRASRRPKPTASIRGAELGLMLSGSGSWPFVGCPWARLLASLVATGSPSIASRAMWIAEMSTRSNPRFPASRLA